MDVALLVLGYLVKEVLVQARVEDEERGLWAVEEQLHVAIGVLRGEWAYSIKLMMKSRGFSRLRRYFM